MTQAADVTPITKLEKAEIAAVERLKPVFETPVAKNVSKLAKVADEPPLQALSCVVLAAGVLTRQPRLRRAGLRMLVAHSIATGLKNLVKNRVDRTRPKLLDQGEYRLEPGQSKAKNLRSFPSGHAAGVTAVARAVSREYRIGKVGSLTTSVLAVLQVVRRNHFPSDALAGAGLGVVAEVASHRILKHLVARGRRG